jgi:acetyl-CoA carboxylase biotin carboxylase subunit
VAFAREIAYRNLGTVEFILDRTSGEFYFLEMNCRIQVEHPVTEAVTGSDLVGEQLRIAAGGRLSLAQSELKLRGHAVECRLTAEDVEHDFRPTPGTLSRFSIPPLPGLRVDTHCEPGAQVPPYYDSLLAKLIAHGSDRQQALGIMADALERTEVAGVPTNRELLWRVLGHPDLIAGPVSTRWLEQQLPELQVGLRA